jgi:hypothetical protein
MKTTQWSIVSIAVCVVILTVALVVWPISKPAVDHANYINAAIVYHVVLYPDGLVGTEENDWTPKQQDIGEFRDLEEARKCAERCISPDVMDQYAWKESPRKYDPVFAGTLWLTEPSWWLEPSFDAQDKGVRRAVQVNPGPPKSQLMEPIDVMP